TVFLADDTTVALAYGVAASRGLLDHTEQLAMTAGLVADVYGGAVTDGELAVAGYVHSDGDDAWWIPSGTALYPADPAAGFYLPTGSRDLFGNANAAEYDAYHLFVTGVTDAAGNRNEAEFDYRALRPTLVTDANGNQTAVELDELGVAVATAVMGPAGSGLGDTLADP